MYFGVCEKCYFDWFSGVFIVCLVDELCLVDFDWFRWYLGRSVFVGEICVGDVWYYWVFGSGDGGYGVFGRYG